ncbi:CHASE domain-containing protein [Spartinivicinus poritis]|uniref:histidine kinase n=1 Tax=Spartinivicinus poritis TaxID=2994640 RepID=A0ABT5U2X1_9GAMM|nr:CHASE domain-containing protein [Spartinivicinus sp. A2-2]MDE1460706.1 CHASE domain-containing protein [Spartinivicinus sp. A2-2]
MYLQTIKEYFLKILVLAVSYAVIGKLSILLAIPPGFASPVWPPAGVALGLVLLWGYRYWPGILLGSMTINIWVSQEAYTNIIALANGLGIALGASLQAVISKWLIEKVTQPPWELEEVKQITAIVVVGGPICCIVSASVGNTVLLLNGVIQTDAWLPAWLTWWIGDSIGVMACAPILLALFTSSITTVRKTVVTTPLMALLITVIYLFFSAQRWEQEQQNSQAIKEMERSVEYMQDYLDGYLISLYALERLFHASHTVSRDNFKRFANGFINKYPGIQALEWVPIVPASKREQLIKSAHAEGLKNFDIVEYNPRLKKMERVKPRDTYYPVFYIEPMTTNEAALGYDIGSNYRRLKAIQKALTTLQPVATEKITLVQTIEPEPAFLVLMPVNKNNTVLGFVLGVFKIKPLMDKLQSHLGNLNAVFSIYDKKNEVIYESAPMLKQQEKLKPLTNLFNLSQVLSIADREWRLDIQFKTNINLEHRFWSIWLLIVGGFFIIGMLSYVLLIITGQAESTERKIQRRTVELEASKQALSEQAQALSKSNQALEEFAYIASHDLKEPLRGVSNYCQFINDDYKDKLDQHGGAMLDNIRKLTRKMECFINDLLKYSRVDHIEGVRIETNLMELLSDVKEGLFHLIQKANVDILVKEPLPIIYCNKTKVEELFTNLITNAIKYNNSEQIQIVIGCDLSKVPAVFYVQDNGIGIPEHLQHKVFKIFQRLHTEDEYGGGTGAGLSIVKKIIEGYRGSIWVNSKPGAGSTFCFTLPLAMSKAVNSAANS